MVSNAHNALSPHSTGPVTGENADFSSLGLIVEAEAEETTLKRRTASSSPFQMNAERSAGDGRHPIMPGCPLESSIHRGLRRKQKATRVLNPVSQRSLGIA